MPHNEHRPYDTSPNTELSLQKHPGISSPLRRSRQKACTACASSKTRCNLERPICSRCLRRGDRCEYASITGSSTGEAYVPPPSAVPVSTRMVDEVAATHDESWPANSVEFTLPSPSSLGGSRQHDQPSFQVPSETSGPTSDPAVGETPVGRISLRWLAVLAPDDLTRPPARSKHLSPSTIYFCSRFLRALPLQLADLSPTSSSVFVHPSHLRPTPAGPLANAITLIKMFRTHAPGSEALVVQTVMNELSNIMLSVRPTRMIRRELTCDSTRRLTPSTASRLSSHTSSSPSSHTFTSPNPIGRPW